MAEWPFAAVAGAGVTLAAVPDRARYSLRTRSPDGLPVRVLTTAPVDGGAALCLGPDEWLLILATGAPPPRVAAVQAVADVSDRNVALSVEGEAAAALLQCGCALDLSVAAFPPGKATRTLYEGVEIVLWRTAEHRFHVEVWRSFAAWLWAALAQAAGDLPPERGQGAASGQ